MPLVQVRYNAALEGVPALIKELPRIVAEELAGTEPGSELTADDIEVWANPMNAWDIVHNQRLQIVVDANEFPSRLDNRERRQRGITDRVDALLVELGMKVKGWVWLRLMPASFGELDTTALETDEDVVPTDL